MITSEEGCETSEKKKYAASAHALSYHNRPDLIITALGKPKQMNGKRKKEEKDSGKRRYKILSYLILTDHTITVQNLHTIGDESLTDWLEPLPPT